MVSRNFVECGMPIDVNHEDVKRRVVLMESSNQLIELLVCISPVSGPPGPECKPRRQRNLSRHARVIVESALVVVAVAEEVPIFTLSRRARRDPRPRAAFTCRKGKIIGVKKLTRAVVHDGPAITRDESWFQLHVRSLDSVERARGTEQVADICHAWLPHHLFSVQAECDAEIVRGKFAVRLSGGVNQLQHAGLNYCASTIKRGLVREFRNGEPAIQEDERSVIFELAVRGPLHANELGRQNRETCMSGSDDGTWIGNRVITAWSIRGSNPGMEESQRPHRHHEQATTKPAKQIRYEHLWAPCLHSVTGSPSCS